MNTGCGKSKKKQDRAVLRDYAQNIVETIREPLLVLDKDLRVIIANRSFYEKFKVSPSRTENALLYELGNRQWDVPRLRKLLEQILAKKTAIEAYRVRHDFPDIGEKTMLINARRLRRGPRKPGLILLAIEDITDREEARGKARRATERAYAAEKMASLGKLAGVIGHDLRNSLAIMHNCVELIKTEVPSEARTGWRTDYIAKLEKEIDIADRMTSNILTYSREKKPAPGNVDIVSVIKRTLEKVPAPDNVSVKVKEDEKLPRISGDEVQLAQAFSNIIANAFQAMPEGGDLTVSLRKKGRSVEADFRDTGEGIAKDDLKRVFDALYSTKPKGTGLGMYACRSIIKKHKGDIHINSEVGKGTKVTVRLPAAARGKKK